MGADMSEKLPRYKQVMRAITYLLHNQGIIEDDKIIFRGQEFTTAQEWVDWVLAEVPALKYPGRVEDIP